jgi:hypothetical protein
MARFTVLSAVPAALAVLLAAGCPEPEVDVPRDCPDDEVCSDLAPAGLVFFGSHVESSWTLGPATAHATAVGGTQTLLLFDPHRGLSLTHPIDASTRGAALGVEDVDANRVRVRGLGAGSAMLRITPRGSDELLDRATLHTAVVARVALSPPGERRSPGARRDAWLAGAAVAAHVALQDSAGHPVVDDSMAITWADGGPAFDQCSFHEPACTSWFIARVPARDTSADLTVRAGDRTFVVPLERAPAVDAVVATVDTSGAEAAGAVVCFEAHAGDDQRVVGLDWSFELDGTAHAAALAKNCVIVDDRDGPRTVVGRAGGQSGSVVVGGP